MDRCVAGRETAGGAAALREHLTLPLDPPSHLALRCEQCQRCAQDLHKKLFFKVHNYNIT